MGRGITKCDQLMCGWRQQSDESGNGHSREAGKVTCHGWPLLFKGSSKLVVPRNLAPPEILDEDLPVEDDWIEQAQWIVHTTDVVDSLPAGRSGAKSRKRRTGELNCTVAIRNSS